MPTTKNRLNITLPDDVERVLSALSKRDNMPRATKAAELLRLALEIEADIYFGEIAEERNKTKRSLFVSHEKAWKQFS